MEELTRILSTMEDVPPHRKTINIPNLAWLRRNLGFRNSDNTEYNRAMQLIKDLETKLLSPKSYQA